MTRTGQNRPDRIAELASSAAFGRPLITNVFRGLIAEAIVAEALETEWRWCSSDYASYDFEHLDGTRLEVKQSAARQTWTSAESTPNKPSFDIRARSGRWEGAKWIEAEGRAADLYIFAYHPVATDDADHRNPCQWIFHVVRTDLLPATQRLSLKSARGLSTECNFDGLGRAVADAREVLLSMGERSTNLQPAEAKRD